MKNKLIINIIIANFLWSFIPILVKDLFNDVSILSVIFLRFLVSGVILLLIALSLIIINNNFTSNKKIPLTTIRHLFSHKNKRFYNMKNRWYFAIMGFFGIVLQIIWYFLTIKTTSIAFAMTGFQISIILVAIYEHGIKSERLDIFKILYLTLLLFSVGIIVFVKSQEPSSQGSGFDLIGIIYLILFTISLTFFQITVGRDAVSKKDLKITNKIQFYKTIRALIKMSITFLLGVLFMFPFLLIFQLIFPISDLAIEIISFFNEFQFILSIFIRWEVIFIIFFSTILPFLLIFVTSALWKPYNLTYSQWSSILTLIEPIGALIFGVILVNEYFPTELLLIVVFLLVVSILFRYAHELKNIVNAFILIDSKAGTMKSLPLKLLKFQGVMNVDTLAGTHDIFLNVKSSSIKDFYYLVNNQIRKLDEIKKLQILFINKIEKLEE